MSDFIFGTLLPVPPHFDEQVWVDWISDNNSNHIRTQKMQTVSGRRYPFERVDLNVFDDLDCNKLDAFSHFLDFCFALPVHLKRLSFISQIPGHDCHWHHDFDGGGIGVRICLVGKDDGTLEILPTLPMDETINVQAAPYVDVGYGAISRSALPLVKEPLKVIVPRGVKTGKVWALSSRLALHRVKATPHRRVQCILSGSPKKPEIQALLERENVIYR